jgi:proline racemase
VIVVKTIDAHSGGEPLRLIVDGFPAPRGKTMAEKRDWAARHADHLRRIVMLEPRGHIDMYGAVLTEPTSPGSHAGVLFMHNDGFPTMSGHGVLAVATIAFERNLIVPGAEWLAFDTPAGTVRATVHQTSERAGRAGKADPVNEAGGTGQVDRVSFVNVPSFVLQGGVDVVLGNRRVRADIAFGGAFYAIVDGESVGVPLDAAHVPDLRRMGAARAVDATVTIAHPTAPHLTGIDGTIFTGPPRDSSADLRNVTVFANGAVDRSACGTGTSAVMAVIDAMGLLDDQRPFVHESVLGTTVSGRVVGRTMVGAYGAIAPRIQGSAWITGEHTFVVDPDDPLHEGVKLY